MLPVGITCLFVLFNEEVKSCVAAAIAEKLVISNYSCNV